MPADAPDPPPPAAGPLAYATPAAEPPRRAMLAVIAAAAVLVAVEQAASLAESLAASMGIVDPSSYMPLTARLSTADGAASLAGEAIQAIAGLVAGVLAGLSVASGRPARGLAATLGAVAAGALLVNTVWVVKAISIGLGFPHSILFATSVLAAATMWLALALACRRTRPA